MSVAARIRFADARAELGCTQADVVRLSGVSKQTVVNAEKGLAIQRIQAHMLLRFLNTEREKVGMPALSIDEVGLKIFIR